MECWKKGHSRNCNGEGSKVAMSELRPQRKRGHKPGDRLVREGKKGETREMFKGADRSGRIEGVETRGNRQPTWSKRKKRGWRKEKRHLSAQGKEGSSKNAWGKRRGEKASQCDGKNLNPTWGARKRTCKVGGEKACGHRPLGPWHPGKVRGISVCKRFSCWEGGARHEHKGEDLADDVNSGGGRSMPIRNGDSH